jgi:hypothetical protein
MKSLIYLQIADTRDHRKVEPQNETTVFSGHRKSRTVTPETSVPWDHKYLYNSGTIGPGITPAQWNPRDQPSLQTEDMEEDNMRWSMRRTRKGKEGGQVLEEEKKEEKEDD